MNIILFLNIRLTRISDLNISNDTIELDHQLAQLLKKENAKELGKFLINAYK